MSKRIFSVGYLIVDGRDHLYLHTLRSNRAECWSAMTGEDESDFQWSPKLRRGKRELLKRSGFRCVFVAVEESITAQGARQRALAFIEKHFSAPIKYDASMEDALIRLIRGQE